MGVSRASGTPVMFHLSVTVRGEPRKVPMVAPELSSGVVLHSKAVTTSFSALSIERESVGVCERVAGAQGGLVHHLELSFSPPLTYAYYV